MISIFCNIQPLQEEVCWGEGARLGGAVDRASDSWFRLSSGHDLRVWDGAPHPAPYSVKNLLEILSLPLYPSHHSRTFPLK